MDQMILTALDDFIQHRKNENSADSSDSALDQLKETVNELKKFADQIKTITKNRNNKKTEDELIEKYPVTLVQLLFGKIDNVDGREDKDYKEKIDQAKTLIENSSSLNVFKKSFNNNRCNRIFSKMYI